MCKTRVKSRYRYKEDKERNLCPPWPLLLAQPILAGGQSNFSASSFVPRPFLEYTIDEAVDLIRGPYLSFSDEIHYRQK